MRSIDILEIQVKLYAEFATHKLLDFLRASSYYNLEAVCLLVSVDWVNFDGLPAQAYNICTERDLVPEMVFLLGRMGNNKKALYLIIDRLGDVSRVRIISLG